MVAKISQTLGPAGVAALFAAIIFEITGSLLGVAWPLGCATVALFVVTICLPLKVLRTPATEHHRLLPYVLLTGAIVAMLLPSQIYFDAGLLKAGSSTVTSYIDCLYFSAATWCSVDCEIVPNSSGRWIVVCHALLGYAYLAFLIVFVELHVSVLRERGRRT